ncbi:hypothetical protein HPP92_016430 [Vanilla planifolia]|uniref:Uncharacterized protein n=1 Tax=Vanilla planifolia TaxID=51239 RepID=A0A835QAW3_VANPL|nr:hypothetical protein HPP92_016430 [Vanilla planifolia]
MPDRSKPRKSKYSSSTSPLESQPRTLIVSIFRMARRPFIRPGVAASLSLLLLFIFYHSFLYPSSSPSFSFSSNSSSPSGARRPKIYLYDLPRRFTYGVIESYLHA